jgi:hypothetical protein
MSVSDGQVNKDTSQDYDVELLMLGRTLVLEKYPRFMDLIIIGYERNQGERTRSILDGPFTNEERKA